MVLPVAPIQERIVVTPTNTAAPADQTGVSVTAFTAADIERRDVPLVADLLRSTPGAMVVRSGGAGAQTSLFVRGGESSYNKVLLDGIPLNEPGGTFNFSNLTTGNIERIEVVRGAQSALFGSDAMSSVVQLFTGRAGDRDGRPHADVLVEGGTYGTVRGSALASGATGRLDYTAARRAVFNGQPRSEQPLRQHDAVRNRRHRADAQRRRSGSLRAASSNVSARRARPRSNGRTSTRSSNAHDGVGGASFDQQVSPRFRQRAAYSLAVSNQQSTNLTEDPPYTPQFGDRSAPFEFSDFMFDSRTKLRRHHASYQADVRLSTDAAAAGDHRLTLLADWDGERASLVDNLAGTIAPASRNNAGVSIQHQALWRRTFVTVGVRLEHNDSFGGAAVPRASVAYVVRASAGLLGDTRLRASAGLGIKEPTILQSFSPSPFFHGNPDLQPERSRTLEAGIEQRVAHDHGRVDLAWFDNRYRDLISTRTTDPATFAAEYFNIGLSRARGLEISGDAVIDSGFRARAGYTFVDSAIVARRRVEQAT